jgi:hypothetical protein
MVGVGYVTSYDDGLIDGGTHSKGQFNEWMDITLRVLCQN